MPGFIYRGLVCISIFFISFALPVNALGEEIFAELNDLNQVQSTYLSSRFAHNMPRWQSEYGNHAIDLSTGFDSLYSYQCYSVEAVNLAKKILKSYLQDNKDIEVVLRTKEAMGEYVIYERFSPDNKVIQMIIWSCEAPNICEICVVDWKEGYKRNNSNTKTSE